jgi:hypothetical protein
VRTPISATGSARHASARFAAAVDRLPSDFSRPASVTLPGSRIRRSSAGGSQRLGASPGPVVRAARGCSASLASIATAFRTPLTVSASTPATSSRGAVTAAIARGGASPEGAAPPCELTAKPAHNRPPSAGLGAALPVDIVAAVAVDASNFAGVLGTPTNPSSLTRITRVVYAVSDEGAPGQAGQGRREDGERTHFECVTESAGPRTPISAHQLRTTPTQPTTSPKPTWCGPKSTFADRTQTAHNRKEQV